VKYPITNWKLVQFTFSHATKQTKAEILYVCFNGHLPDGPRLASTRMSPFWISLEPRVMDLLVTTGAKDVQSSSQNVTTNKPTTSFFTGRMPFLSPNQQCQSTEGKKAEIETENK